MIEEPGHNCESDDHWSSTLITGARKSNPLVTEVVSVRIEQLLKGQFSGQPLTPTELKSIAIGLIGDMIPVSPKSEATQ